MADTNGWRVLAVNMHGMFYIALKDLRAYYFKPPNISWGILFPFAFVLAFAIRNPGETRDLVPGLLGLNLLFGTTSMEANVIVFERRIGSLERLMLAPVSLAALLDGKMLGGMFFGLIVTGAVYLPEAKALTWKKGGHNISFHAYEIATSNVEDREEAVKELEGLIDLVNCTWERRAEITPDTSTRQRPTPMAIFKLLPQTNCKQCGEPTCYTFALRLSTSQKELADCPLLFEPQYIEKRIALEEIVIKGPAIE
jgi:ArsR family metal-binding transcriptional regulator